ncbi:MAG: hypothetical protein ABSD56_14305 [Bryobacteraceae bacterium]|jgi:hypothetical protein
MKQPRAIVIQTAARQSRTRWYPPKAIGSVLTKGIEAILLEWLAAAEAFRIGEPIRWTLVEFLAGHAPEEPFELLITNHEFQAHRRAGEMKGLLRLLRAEGIDAAVTDVTCRRPLWSAALRAVESAPAEPRQLRDVIPLAATLWRGASCGDETRTP